VTTDGLKITNARQAASTSAAVNFERTAPASGRPTRRAPARIGARTTRPVRKTSSTTGRRLDGSRSHVAARGAARTVETDEETSATRRPRAKKA
jgi:hypothetical protein